VTAVRVVIADDHPMFRYGLSAVLRSTTEIDLVGVAADGNELLRLTRQTTPDVVVTDLAMPGLSGSEATRYLLADQPALAVLILTMHHDETSVFDAMRAGARGYLLKSTDRAELITTIQAIARGEAVYSQAIAQRIFEFFRARTDPAIQELTPRERDVLAHLAQGARNRDIAQHLGIAEKTVRNHLSSIFVKLQVDDRTAAAIKAKQMGL
jgi:DNA-binding NarL/FixJ family response regulator